MAEHRINSIIIMSFKVYVQCGFIVHFFLLHNETKQDGTRTLYFRRNVSRQNITTEQCYGWAHLKYISRMFVVDYQLAPPYRVDRPGAKPGWGRYKGKKRL